jgi:hypothetical protein
VPCGAQRSDERTLTRVLAAHADPLDPDPALTRGSLRKTSADDGEQLVAVALEPRGTDPVAGS